MKKILIFLFLILIISCDDINHAPETFYFNESGTIILIQKEVLDMSEYRVGCDYRHGTMVDVYYIRLDRDTLLMTQLNQYNWCAKSNLFTKKVGDKVFFEYIKKERFYTVK